MFVRSRHGMPGGFFVHPFAEHTPGYALIFRDTITMLRAVNKQTMRTGIRPVKHIPNDDRA